MPTEPIHSVPSEPPDPDELDRMLDEALAATFPASDPVAIHIRRQPERRSPGEPADPRQPGVPGR